jgi:hypothetical protein
VFKQTLNKAKLQSGKRGQETEQNGRSPLRKRRSAMDCSDIKEEEEEEV